MSPGWVTDRPTDRTRRKKSRAGSGVGPTRMRAAGVPLRTVSELLGHSFVAVTGDVHGHVSNQGARSAVQRLSTAMGW